MSTQTGSPEYHHVPRAAIRSAHSRNPYAYYVRRLPERLRALAAELEIPPGGRLLDYGCADAPYRSFFPATVEYVGADLPGNLQAAVRLNPDGTVPVPDAEFDAVLSTQVLEHVEDPRIYLSECWRVLRPGGRLLLSTHGVFPYHPDPVDLWRWTCEGLRREVQSAGFQIVRFEGIVGLAATGVQLVQDAISYRIPARWVPRLALVMQPLVALADRFQSAQSRDYNAAVFALVGLRST
jgi:SAM-dependent methyltransferase